MSSCPLKLAVQQDSSSICIGAYQGNELQLAGTRQLRGGRCLAACCRGFRPSGGFLVRVPLGTLLSRSMQSCREKLSGLGCSPLPLPDQGQSCLVPNVQQVNGFAYF